MSMIESIRFANYRAFKDEGDLVLRPVTLLIGRNSSGKSSLCRLVKFISLAIEADEWPLIDPSADGFSFSGADIFFGRMTAGPLMIGADFSGGTGFKTEYYIDGKKAMKVFSRNVINGEKESQKKDIDTLKNEGNSLLDKAMLKEVGLEKSPFQFDVNYIQSLRATAKPTYRNGDIPNYNYVGSDGANAYPMLINAYTSKKSPLFNNVAEWMEDNLDNQRLDIDTDLENIEFRISRAKNSVRIQDVGQGISQVLPIIVQSFVQQQGNVTIIEEPELHLHPSVHAAVMECMARSAKSNGCKYVIETHSENMLLAVRRMVKRRELSQEDVSIAYVDMDESSGTATVKPIELNDNGSLKWWPTGVFGEAYDLLNDILV